MKKLISLIAAVLMFASIGGYALAHCGHCGIADGYVCAKDNIASQEPGKCTVCGGDLAKGDIKEVVPDKEGGQVTYVPAPAETHA